MSPLILSVIVVASIGLIAGLGLSICSVIMSVKTDETVEALRNELPGANCGACGYSGCDGYAEALSKGEAKPGLCTPGGVELNNKLGEILGVKVEMTEPKAAKVLCNGSFKNTSNKMFYTGIRTCKAANMLYSGSSACAFGCLGFGDCQRACIFDAITVKDGLAIVDKEKCTACSACVKACPKGIIELLPANAKETVLCSNKDKGAAAKKVCEVACIACGKCVKSCNFDAITVENNLARIDYEKCTACGACLEACPTKCIRI